MEKYLRRLRTDELSSSATQSHPIRITFRSKISDFFLRLANDVEARGLTASSCSGARFEVIELLGMDVAERGPSDMLSA
jgi:hypothetical protein